MRSKDTPLKIGAGFRYRVRATAKFLLADWASRPASGEIREALFGLLYLLCLAHGFTSSLGYTVAMISLTTAFLRRCVDVSNAV